MSRTYSQEEEWGRVQELRAILRALRDARRAIEPLDDHDVPDTADHELAGDIRYATSLAVGRLRDHLDKMQP